MSDNVISLRGASPLGLPHTLSREPLRRLAPFAWLASLRSLASFFAPPCLAVAPVDLTVRRRVVRHAARTRFETSSSKSDPCPRADPGPQCSSSSLQWIRYLLAQRRKPNLHVGKTGWIPGRRLRPTSTAVFGHFIAGKRRRAYPFTVISTRTSGRCSRTKANSTPGSAREARIRPPSTERTDCLTLPDPS